MAGPGPEAWRRGRDRAQAVGPAGLALPPSSAPHSPTQGGRSHGPPGPAVGARRVSEVPEQDRGRPAPGPRPPRPPAPRHQSPGSLAPCVASGKLLSIRGFSLWNRRKQWLLPQKTRKPAGPRHDAGTERAVAVGHRERRPPRRGGGGPPRQQAGAEHERPRAAATRGRQLGALSNTTYRLTLWRSEAQRGSRRPSAGVWGGVRVLAFPSF